MKLYATCFFSLAILDFFWIALLMKKFYVENMRSIGRLAGDSFEPVIWAAVGVYIALAIGIVHFVLPKLDSGSSWLSCFGVGALFGLVVYATYDLTNYSTLKDWPLHLALVDMVWGTILCGLVTLLACFVKAL